MSDSNRIISNGLANTLSDFADFASAVEEQIVIHLKDIPENGLMSQEETDTMERLRRLGSMAKSMTTLSDALSEFAQDEAVAA